MEVMQPMPHTQITEVHLLFS